MEVIEVMDIRHCSIMRNWYVFCKHGEAVPPNRPKASSSLLSVTTRRRPCRRLRPYGLAHRAWRKSVLRRTWQTALPGRRATASCLTSYWWSLRSKTSLCALVPVTLANDFRLIRLWLISYVCKYNKSFLILFKNSVKLLILPFYIFILDIFMEVSLWEKVSKILKLFLVMERI